MLFIDTETTGFTGPVVLIQYAIDEDGITLFEPWCSPIHETLTLIQFICTHTVIGFNLVFDWFHLQKLYNCLFSLAEKVGLEQQPRDHINTYANLEAVSRDGKCVKSKGAFDLLLHARKTKYQSTMDRKKIVIRRIPRALANNLIDELDSRLQFEDYLFANRKQKTNSNWKIFDIKDSPDFVNVVCSFNASAKLKTLCLDSGLISRDRLLMSDLDLPTKPMERAWAPFATAISSQDNYWFCKIGSKQGLTWPGVIKKHIEFWRFNDKAREYATDDVKDTRALYHHFNDPTTSDMDSILACMFGSIRWKGYLVNINMLNVLKIKEQQKIESIPTSPAASKRWIMENMSEIEIEATRTDKGTIADTSKKVILEALAISGNKRAKQVLEARQAAFKINLFNKLLKTGRLHPSTSVIGSLSGRASGRTETKDAQPTSGLNALGIPNDPEIRECFTLAHSNMYLNGGDFDAFEVSIEDAVVNDPILRNELLTCYKCEHVRLPKQIDDINCPNCNEPKSRRKIHGLFAMALFPGKTYEQIEESKGTSDDLYDKGKRGFFGSILYGGNEHTLQNRLNIPEEDAKKARDSFFNKYEGIKKHQIKIIDRFCTIRQPNGLGTRFTYYEPEDFITSLFEFKRFFTLENRASKIIFNLAERPPKEWLKINEYCIRKEHRGRQKIGGAVMSALFSTACTIQAQVMRAALNHIIQSTGSTITKLLQIALWQLQPVGVHEWLIMPYQVHDEVMTPAKKGMEQQIEQIVTDFVQKHRGSVPLLKMDWKSKMKNWAEK